MKTVLLLAFLTAQISFAHSDHPPRVAACIAKACTQEQIEKAIPTTLDILVAKKVVDESWSKIKVEKIESKQFKKGPEWVATLFDDSKKDKTKQRLYIFITKDGYLNGANFTGE